jgi:serine/threonine-protein kinase
MSSDDKPGWDDIFGWASAPALSAAAGSIAGPVPPPAGEPPPPLPAPYTDLGRLGMGGMGEVRAVWDGRFSRRLALKLMRRSLARSGSARRRFLREGSMTAGLAHPGIVAVHDRGELPDGRLWFTMKEVRGQTLDALGRPPARRWVELLLRVCEAVGYAHQQGIVHRDLKPANVMVGEFGEVMVMDWGLARRLDENPASQRQVDAELAAFDPPSDPALTGAGARLGTPGWMAPEQRRTALVEPPADVWALGAMLRLAHGEDDELDAIIAKACSPEAADRYPEAGALAAQLRAWLDGSLRRERALRLLDTARAELPRIAALRAKADHREARAAQRLQELGPRSPVGPRAAAWRWQDEARALREAAEAAEVEALQRVRGALQVDPDLLPAHALLAEHHRQEVVRAEARADSIATTRHLAGLRAHDVDGRHAAFLRGHGRLDLDSAPSGVRVQAWRLAPRERRLQPVEQRILGTTPLRSQPLPPGSWLLELGDSGVRVPVQLDRLGHWQGGRVPLDPAPDGACLVPAGPFRAGGDPEACDSLPACTPRLPAFWIQRHPVTVAQWAAWLDWLLEQDGPAAADQMAPRSPEGGPAGLLRDGAHHRCAPDPTGQVWRPDEPVTLVTWRQATAYARWRADQTGLPWRLPRELEWEKAARGVDGRAWPFGHHLDPAWAFYVESLGDSGGRAPVTAWPEDRSVYGVHGLAGGVRDLCADPWRERGWIDESGHMMDIPNSPAPLRMVRGGSALSAAPLTRAACRFVVEEDQPLTGVGLRLACSLPPETP